MSTPDSTQSPGYDHPEGPTRLAAGEFGYDRRHAVCGSTRGYRRGLGPDRPGRHRHLLCPGPAGGKARPILSETRDTLTGCLASSYPPVARMLTFKHLMRHTFGGRDLVRLSAPIMMSSGRQTGDDRTDDVAIPGRTRDLAITVCNNPFGGGRV